MNNQRILTTKSFHRSILILSRIQQYNIIRLYLSLKVELFVNEVLQLTTFVDL